MSKAVKWSLLLLLFSAAVIPVQLLFQIDYEEHREYWCSDAHYYEARCEAAERAYGQGWIGLTVTGLVFLGSLGVLFDRLVLAGTHDEHDEADEYDEAESASV